MSIYIIEETPNYQPVFHVKMFTSKRRMYLE